MFEKDSEDPLRELMHVIRQLAEAGSGQPALFPDQNISAGELVRAFDQRALAVRDSYDDRLSSTQLESLAALEKKLTGKSRRHPLRRKPARAGTLGTSFPSATLRGFSQQICHAA